MGSERRDTGNSGDALDRAGIVASSVCALHCFLGAIVAASASAWRVFGDERIELGFLVVALALAVLSVHVGFRRHRDWKPIGFVVLAVVPLGLARATNVAETVLSIGGAAMLIVAHTLNLRALRAWQRCC